ncbi:hypothetical protein PsorP6_000667 [Peronosclerospora sorghi]|uniref:Uncharacterized protein n=1 Tax=Peronosclerospora sorghi TaxID=230839 RepID=A0ACC0WX39_9STRA|nr:hypothetical protein PsorP6_000667 [Peronosclerospora sorghi]
MTTSVGEEESPLPNEKEISSSTTSTPLSPDIIEGNESEMSGRPGKRPRREDTALFLEKTYELLDQCPPELACWTAHGNSFVVKQPCAFAERVVPTYVKHRKFRSFVRQLHLYGFRIVRATGETDLEAEVEPGSDMERDDPEALEPKDWWEFRHERFVRGRRDLLCEIKRRASTETKTIASSASGAGVPVDRVEFEDLRAQVSGLREEMQSLQRLTQHVSSLLQTLLQRGQSGDGERGDERVAVTNTLPVQPQLQPLPSIALPSPHSTFLQLRQAYPAQNTPRDGRTPRTPASGSYLRPVQSLIMATASPSTRPPPSPRPTLEPYVSTPPYSQDQLHRKQLGWYPPSSLGHPSPTTPCSSHKRLRVDAATGRMDSLATCSAEKVAVRELSHLASEIRTDLLRCITARVTGFLRVHRDQGNPTKEADADAVGEAVSSDIRHKLTVLEASTSASDPKFLDLETIAMYRVEILKFISRELPRAVQEALDKRVLAPEKLSQRSPKDRSLLALFVQKAQKALERQMRTERVTISTGR